MKVEKGTGVLKRFSYTYTKNARAIRGGLRTTPPIGGGKRQEDDDELISGRHRFFSFHFVTWQVFSSLLRYPGVEALSPTTIDHGSLDQNGTAEICLDGTPRVHIPQCVVCVHVYVCDFPQRVSDFHR